MAFIKSEPVTLDKACDVTAWVSDDETRYNLTSVHLDVDTGCVVATNGHVMIIVPMKTVAGIPTTEGEALSHAANIPADALKRAFKAVPKGKRVPIGLQVVAVTNGTPGEHRLATWDAAATPTTSVLASPDVTFPNYGQVLPSDEPKATVGVDPHYLRKLADYAIANGVKTVKLEVRGELDPITAQLKIEEGRTATAVIMPMRL